MTSNEPSTAIRVMQWPARTCYPYCGHADCERRRLDVFVPCVVCESRIVAGERYRVLTRINGAVVTQVHEDCERMMVER